MLLNYANEMIMVGVVLIIFPTIPCVIFVADVWNAAIGIISNFSHADFKWDFVVFHQVIVS